jgi:hypothetical protein
LDDGIIQQSNQYTTPKAEPSLLVEDPNLARLGRIDTQMVAARLLTLPDFPTEMQDLEDDLKHVIINDPIDYVAPSNQSTDEIP